ncbi:MAG: LysR family transcriptional regulator [Bdellovibrio sp.]|nr:LysR family transcriptional regulator [Bdellovibrio sp.]
MKTTFEEIQIFTAIADSGSITKAADQLGQTLSSLSRSLGRLEKKLGVSLFRRTTRRLDLTEEGEQFLMHARDIMSRIEMAEDLMRDKGNAPSGVIRLDSASPFVLHAIVPYIQEFTALYPAIQLELHSNERVIDLLEKRIDVAFRIGKLEDSTMKATFLGASRRRLLASPEYLKKHGNPKTAEELSQHRLLGFTAPKELNLWPIKDDRGQFLAQNLFVAASSGETLLQLVKAGAGIACLADFMTGPERSSGELVQVMKSQTLEIKEEIHAVYYKNIGPSQRASLFVKFLKNKLRHQL